MYDNTDTMAAASASPSEICSFRKDRPLAFRRAQSSAFEYQRMGRSGQRSCFVGGSAGYSLNRPTGSLGTLRQRIFRLSLTNGTVGFASVREVAYRGVAAVGGAKFNGSKGSN